MVGDGRRLAAILFTDVAGFTGLAQADEARALRLLREQAEIVHAALPAHRGREVKSMGDGLLLEFPSALDAVQCAVDLQRGLHERSSATGSTDLQVRIGIHVGDVEGAGADILGDAVNIASRVEPLADPGGICLSVQAYDQVRTKVPYRFEALGPTSLKGLQSPLDVYRVVLPWADRPPRPSVTTAPRLAVLPLANISPDPADEYLAEGLTEELISMLSRLQGLRVIARTSVSPYKNAPKPIRQIGAELSVGAVLEGSVRRVGNRLRITLQLIDAASEEHRWAETYDRELQDVFAIQADVAERTARALRVELLGAEREALRHLPTANVEAYEYYLKGVWAFHRTADQGWRRTGVDEASRYFEAAIAKDPGFSPAYSSYANLLIAAMGEAIPRPEVEPRARSLVQKGLELDPGSAEAHMALGNFVLQVELDWAKAGAELGEAIRLGPSNLMAHAWNAVLHQTLGQPEEGLHELDLATEFGPRFLQLTYARARFLGDLGRFDQALALVDRVLGEDPTNQYLRVRRARLLLTLGRREEARRELAMAAGPPASPNAAVDRAVLWAELGAPDEARRLLEQHERQPHQMLLRPTLVAELLLSLGDRARALDVLEADCVNGERSLWIDYRRESFDSVREDPRFLSLLERMHLPTRLPDRLMRRG